MGDFEIAVFTSNELYDKCETNLGYGYEARDIAIDIIDGAFSRSYPHSVTTNPGDKIVYPPKETKDGPFTARVPCETYETTWNDLRDWWEYWVEAAYCKDPHAEGLDCSVLLTAASGGGLGANQAAVVGGSFQVADELSGYEEYGYSEAHKKAKNILHEVGHNLTNNMENQDDNTIAHDSGELWEHNGDYTISPMGITGDETTHNWGVFRR